VKRTGLAEDRILHANQFQHPARTVSFGTKKESAMTAPGSPYHHGE